MSFDLVATDDVVSRAIERLLEETHPRDRITLGGSPVAELPPHMVDAARSVASYHRSATSKGDPSLRCAVAEQLGASGVRYSAEQIIITNGAMHALDVCFRTLLSRGDEVLVPEPRFFIDGLVRRAGGSLIGFRSPEEAGFRPDWNDARRRVTPKTRLLFVNSPVNPTGYVFDEEDIAEAARLAHEHDLWIISDESYSHFVYRGNRHLSVASNPAAHDRTVVVRSFSKDYAMPGWRVGYLAAPKTLVPPFARMVEWSCLSVNQVAQTVALAAIQGSHHWVDRFVIEAERHAGTFCRDLNAIPGLRCGVPNGGLNVLVGVRGDATAFVRSLVTDAGIPAHPGDAFGAPGFFRLQFGATDAALDHALGRVAALAQRSLLPVTVSSPAESTT